MKKRRAWIGGIGAFVARRSLVDRRRAESGCSTHARHRQIGGGPGRDKRDAQLRANVTAV
jgi:hypothetical protein